MSSASIPSLIGPMSPVVGRHAAGEARRLQSVAQDFEALLLAELLKGLRRTVPQSNDRSHSGQMCLELLDEQLAVSIARQGGIGLAGILRAYLERAGDGSSGIDRNLSRASPDKR